MIDFFLDEEEGPVLETKQTKPVEKKAEPAPAANDVTAAMNSIKSLISPDLVKSIF
jgi:hypothetical protein